MRTEKKPRRDSDALTKGTTSDILIQALDEEGYGCGSENGIAVKVMGALPGEHARVKYVHVARNRAVGELVKILRHSPDRLASPPCSTYSGCDGCPMVVMKYPAQLSWKMNMVNRELSKHFPLKDIDLRPIKPSPEVLHYRNSAKLVIGGKFSSPVIGIYRRNSHDVIDIGDCPLHHPLINKVVAAVREGIRKGKVPVYSPRSGSGLLRYLVVRVSSSENKAMVVFVTAERSFNEIHHLAKHVQRAVPEVAVLAQNINPSAGNVILGTKDHYLSKDHSLIDLIDGVRFAISPRSFFQVNSGGASIIYNQVREFAALTGTERVVDLYCGVGGISLFLAPQALEVVGIEYVAAAVADAGKNAELNGAHNCRFMAGDAADLLGEISRGAEKVDIVVLNPPRKGCDEAVLQGAARLSPSRIIYVSCSPQSLARDLNILHRLGYDLSAAQPVDMFPQTPHVETVALLKKR